MSEEILDLIKPHILSQCNYPQLVEENCDAQWVLYMNRCAMKPNVFAMLLARATRSPKNKFLGTNAFICELYKWNPNTTLAPCVGTKLNVRQYNVLIQLGDRMSVRKAREPLHYETIYERVYKYDPELIDQYVQCRFMGTTDELVECIYLRMALRGASSPKCNELMEIRNDMIRLVQSTSMGWTSARIRLIDQYISNAWSQKVFWMKAKLKFEI